MIKFRNVTAKLIAAALPVAVAITLSGAAQADTVPAVPAAVVQTIAAPLEVAPAALQVAPAAAVEVAPAADVAPVAPVADASAQEITTNPNAANHDPLGNGAAAGAIVGAVFGAVVCAVTIVGIPLIPLCALGPAFQGALVGLIVGAVAPDVIPQVLP